MGKGVGEDLFNGLLLGGLAVVVEAVFELRRLLHFLRRLDRIPGPAKVS